MYQSSCCSTSLLTIGITELLDFNHPDKYEMASISFMLKIGIFLTAGEGGDFFSCISWSLEASLSLTVYILFSFFPLGCCLFLIDLYFLLFGDTHPFLVENMSCKVCLCGCLPCWSGNNRGLGLELGIERKSELFIWLWLFRCVQKAAPPLGPTSLTAVLQRDWGLKLLAKVTCFVFSSVHRIGRDGHKEGIRIPMTRDLPLLLHFQVTWELLKLIWITCNQNN